MNEVTKIHLGRQAFAISAEAHKELRDYLDAIREQVNDEDVLHEIEIRMAELLAERGLAGEQVILPTDVKFLKEQLGNPKDFAEENEDAPAADKPIDTKRLFRDTDSAMIAGVAAGLANYFGIDVLIVRLLFVIATFAGGWGILIYLVLWLLVPEAKTSSDRLQMIGKAVTIKNLKGVMDRTDIKGAAHRANNSLAGPVNTAFSFVLKVVGTIFVASGVSMLLGLATGAVYAFLRGNGLIQNNIFPVGLKEQLLIYIAAASAGIVALFVILFGLAVYRRKWPLHAWLTGTLIGLMLIGLAVGGALTADIAPQVRDRYNANLHTTMRTEQPFNTVNLTNADGNVNIEFQYSSTYSVSLHYYGHPDLNTVKTTVSGKDLILDTSSYNSSRNCQSLCIPSDYNLTITINSPNTPQVIDPNDVVGTPPNVPVIPVAPTTTPQMQ